MDGNEPTSEQLRSAHLLCKEFIDIEKDRFPLIDSWSDIKPHKALSPTACPGETLPDWWGSIVEGLEDADCESLYHDALEEIERLKNQNFTVKESLSFLIKAIKGGGTNDEKNT